MKPVTFRYSKISSSAIILLCLGTILASLNHLIKFIHAADTVNWLLILSFDSLFGLLILYIAVKFLAPALKGKAALELSSKGIVLGVKNIFVNWSDIAEIGKGSTRTSPYLTVTFKYKTDHGNYIRIPLGPIEGSDSEIYSSVIHFFDHYRT